jgi:hypothetical protein
MIKFTNWNLVTDQIEVSFGIFDYGNVYWVVYGLTISAGFLFELFNFNHGLFMVDLILKVRFNRPFYLYVLI